MSKKLLWGIIAVLLITNMGTLLFYNQEDGEGTRLRSKEPVATIAGEDIMYEEWLEALRKTQGKQTLEGLIDRKVVAKLAEEKEIEVSEKVIDRDIAYLTSMQGPLTEAELTQEKEKWEEELIYRYQLEFLLTEGISIPEEEIRTYYEGYQNQYNFTPAMQLSHILVSDMETANRVYEELGQGASFELLASEYSVDDETKNNGGYLGFIHTNSQFFPNGYEDVALEIEEHTYSEPFAADNGFAVIYLHQILPGIEFDYHQIKPYVENELAMHEERIPLEASLLWDEVEVDWIYANEDLLK